MSMDITYIILFFNIILTLNVKSINQMRTVCRIHEQMQMCLIEAERDWKIDMNRPFKCENWCCFRRQYYECQYKLHERIEIDSSCGRFNETLFKLSAERISKSIDEDCSDYSYSYCTFGRQNKSWIILLAVLAFIFIIGCLIICIYYRFCKSRILE
jgi:hypothetical protein